MLVDKIDLRLPQNYNLCVPFLQLRWTKKMLVSFALKINVPLLREPWSVCKHSPVAGDRRWFHTQPQKSRIPADNCNEPTSKGFVLERNWLVFFFSRLDTFLGEPQVGEIPFSGALSLLSDSNSAVSGPWTSPGLIPSRLFSHCPELILFYPKMSQLPLHVPGSKGWVHFAVTCCATKAKLLVAHFFHPSYARASLGRIWNFLPSRTSSVAGHKLVTVLKIVGGQGDVTSIFLMDGSL